MSVPRNDPETRAANCGRHVFFSTDEVAKMLGVGRVNVLAFIASGQLKACNTSRGCKKPRFKIREADFEAFVELRSTSPSAEPQPKRRKAKVETVPQYV